MKCKIRKNDFVQAIKGKDKGKKGRVIKVFPQERKVLIEGVNFVKKHTRPKSVDKQGGIIQMEKPVAIANVIFFCLKCSKPSRIGIKYLEDGSKFRFCKKCNEVIESK